MLLIPFSRFLLSVLNSTDPCRTPLVTCLRYKNLHLPLPSALYFLPSVSHLLYEKPCVLYSDCLVSSKSFGKRLCQWFFRNLSGICQWDTVIFGTPEEVCNSWYAFIENILILLHNVILNFMDFSFVFHYGFCCFPVM